MPLSNTDYWTEIFSFGDLTSKIRENIAYDEKESPTATNAYSVGQLLWWNGDLYRVIQDMWAGTAFIVGSNIQKTTVEEEIRRVVGEAQDITDNMRDNIATNNTEETAIKEYEKNDLLWLNNKLYQAAYDIPIGTRLIVGANINEKTVDEKINDAYRAIIESRDYVNVKQFGAIGDGVSDDTSAINEAVRSGRIIFFPAGTYRTTDRIQIADSHKYLIGDPGAKIYGDGNHSIIAGDVHVADADSVYLHDITIDGLELYSNGPTTGSGYGISFVQHYPITRVAMYDITIKRCNIHNIGYRGINLYGGGAGTHGTHGIPVFHVED